MSTNSWTNGAGGDWNTPANWTLGVPTAGSAAVIARSGTYTVISSQNNSLGTLGMAKHATLAIGALDFSITSGAKPALAGTISVASGAALKFGSDGNNTTFDNTGSIDLEGGLSVTDFVIAGTVTLTGGGKIDLGKLDEIVSDGQTARLYSKNKISGQGFIGDSNTAITNEAGGIVDANDTSGPLVISSNAFDNAGELEAENGGQLVINDDLTNSGKIIAGAGSKITVEDGIVDGGTVSIAKGGTLDAGGNHVVDMVAPKGTVTNAGTIAADNSDLQIASAVKNTGTGTLSATNDNNLEIDGTVAKGAAVIDTGGVINFQNASSANVTFAPTAGFSILVLKNPLKFTGTVAGMASDSQAYINLGNIQFSDGPIVSALSAKGILTVTDPVTHVVDTIKIVGGGTFTAVGGSSDGTTNIHDPPPGPAGNSDLLTQSIAAFPGGNTPAASGTGNVAEEVGSPNFLTAPAQHGSG